MNGAVRIVEVSPRPSALVASLRGLGYSPETALADLIDNSIGAEARQVKIDIQWNDGCPTVALLDDGKGMSWERLQDALRLGGMGSDQQRDNADLGRFGMGLKTASLSQCCCLTVVSKHDLGLHALSLDVDFMKQNGWIAMVPEPLPGHPFIAELQTQPRGTTVLWERIDELSGLFGLAKEAFFLRLEEIRAHLGMIFHRFIDGDARKIEIILNGRPVKAWDPFQIPHESTRPLSSERLRHAGASISIKPYVLPHRDRFANDKEYNEAGGPGGWAARQGFYVYRGRRLLVAGSWLGLGGARAWTRDDASRLARIQVDLPTNLDNDWRIDVRKSQARPPGALRKRLTDLADHCRNEAREVFAFRGQGPRTRGARHATPAVWLASSSNDGLRYRINREHPVIIACRKAASGLRPLNAVLSIIERTVPVERIWLDVSEAEGASMPGPDAEEAIVLAEQLAELGRTLPPGLSVDQRVDTLLHGFRGDLTILKAELQKKLGKGT